MYKALINQPSLQLSETMLTRTSVQYELAGCSSSTTLFYSF